MPIFLRVWSWERVYKYDQNPIVLTWAPAIPKVTMRAWAYRGRRWDGQTVTAASSEGHLSFLSPHPQRAHGHCRPLSSLSSSLLLARSPARSLSKLTNARGISWWSGFSRFQLIKFQWVSGHQVSVCFSSSSFSVQIMMLKLLQRLCSPHSKVSSWCVCALLAEEGREVEESHALTPTRARAPPPWHSTRAGVLEHRGTRSAHLDKGISTVECPGPSPALREA